MGHSPACNSAPASGLGEDDTLNANSAASNDPIKESILEGAFVRNRAAKSVVMVEETWQQLTPSMRTPAQHIDYLRYNQHGRETDGGLDDELGVSSHRLAASFVLPAGVAEMLAVSPSQSPSAIGDERRGDRSTRLAMTASLSVLAEAQHGSSHPVGGSASVLAITADVVAAVNSDLHSFSSSSPLSGSIDTQLGSAR